ncbi:MAG: hypothetical protein U9N73_09375, partial [Candidatus Auribacterota bacterium]|nr:hypothetical protein [Candidatus Auribacterota bacterium]
MNSLPPLAVFFAATDSQPRYGKRVDQLRASGVDVTVFAFKRNDGRQPSFSPETEVIYLGNLSDNKYLARIPLLVRGISRVRKFIKYDRKVFFFATSPDTLFLARAAGLRYGIYEIGDIISYNAKAQYFAFIEKLLLRSGSSVILTSRYFYDNFYHSQNRFSREQIFVIENRLNRALSPERPGRPRTPRMPLTIGLIGLLRYRKPIEFLLQFVSENSSRYRLECFGVGSMVEEIMKHEGASIKYHGEFNNPKDLPQIYNRIDVNFSVYDTGSLNVRLAIPNKIFESAFFAVPILCGKGTILEKLACKW